MSSLEKCCIFGIAHSSLYFSRYSYIEKKTKISFREINHTKNKLFFFSLSPAPTHHSFTLNLRFFYGLKHKVHHFSKCVWDFPFLVDSIFFLPSFIFSFSKKYGLFAFKQPSTKTCESFSKGQFVTRIFYRIMFSKVVKSYAIISANIKTSVKQ